MKKIPNALSFMFFFAGILLGLTLSVLSMWADFESNFYGFTKQTKPAFYGLSCPILMTANESGTISITITNTSAKPISANVRTEISSKLVPIKTIEFIPIAPGETATLYKTINAENIDLKQFIFAKVLVYSVYPMPDQESTCGVFILPMRGNGTLILIAGTILSLLFTAGGIYFLHKNSLPARRLNPLLFITALIIPTMFFSYLGWWVLTVFLIVVLTLTLVVTSGDFIMQ